jgi:inner membrane protein
MAWWVWVLVGLGLLAAELVTPGGFFAIFFGVAGVLVGILVAAGLAGPPWAEWLLFTVFSVVGVALFRRPLLRRFSQTGTGRPVDRLEGEVAVVQEDVPPGGVGKAELRGSSWSARTAGPAPLGKGRRCRVERVEGLTLWLRPE